MASLKQTSCDTQLVAYPPQQMVGEVERILEQMLQADGRLHTGSPSGHYCSSNQAPQCCEASKMTSVVLPDVQVEDQQGCQHGADWEGCAVWEGSVDGIVSKESKESKEMEF